MNQDQIKELLEKTYSCGICSQVLHRPVTLQCQHTFCYSCLKEMIRSKPNESAPEKRCALCRCRFFLLESDNVNYKIQESVDAFLNVIYSPDEIREMLGSRDKDTLRMELREQVVKELREELQESIMDNTAQDSQQPAHAPFNVAPGNVQYLEFEQVPWSASATQPKSFSDRFWRFMESPAAMTTALYGMMALMPVLIYFPSKKH